MGFVVQVHCRTCGGGCGLFLCVMWFTVPRVVCGTNWLFVFSTCEFVPLLDRHVLFWQTNIFLLTGDRLALHRCLQAQCRTIAGQTFAILETKMFLLTGDCLVLHLCLHAQCRKQTTFASVSYIRTLSLRVASNHKFFCCALCCA